MLQCCLHARVKHLRLPLCRTVQGVEQQRRAPISVAHHRSKVLQSRGEPSYGYGLCRTARRAATVHTGLGRIPFRQREVTQRLSACMASCEAPSPDIKAPPLLVTLAGGRDSQLSARLGETARALGWGHTACDTAADAVDSLITELGGSRADAERTLVFVATLDDAENPPSCLSVLKSLEEPTANARNAAQVFRIVLLSHTAGGDPVTRLRCFATGASMVTDRIDAVHEALARVERCRPRAGAACDDVGAQMETYTCPECRMPGLTENQLHMHGPLYHSHKDTGCNAPCPVCGQPDGWSLHFHNSHGPPADREPPRSHFPAFALVVVRNPTDGRFLMVHEPPAICHSGAPLYWLPAGRVDRGEGFLAAGIRETLEEGGLDVTIKGVLKFSLSGASTATPCPRVTLLAEPVDPSQPPKCIPDWESAGAMWVSTKALATLGREQFRASDPIRLFPAVADGRLVPHGIDTDAFIALERCMELLTVDEHLSHVRRASELLTAWRRLEAEYPVSMFQYH